MMKREPRIVWLASLMAFLAMGGFTNVEENVLGTFVCDFLRSALAAYLI